ncbi:PTS system transporter subunit IIA [Ameyamaea chiangmaiensis NBRC 103196]|nr:PTS fructose transporter subunit IIA [Ameyamaea chiangmaiensis]GBQ66719.1 PTS system transporter subunit IIA [Ameyamaea chiangmaiensis NBRC 103196]
MVLITHGALGETLKAALEHVVGPQEQIECISVDGDDPLGLSRSSLIDSMKRVDSGDGTLMVTDMFGSTPSNLALSVMEEGHSDVLAGVNLPMLVKLAKIRPSRTLAECASIAEMAGRKYISTASHLPAPCLGGAQSCRDLPPDAHHPSLSASDARLVRTPATCTSP